MLPILICTLSLCNVTLLLLPARGRNISPHFKSELSLSLARTKRMWWKWWLWLPSLGLKKTFRTCTRSVGVLYWNCHEKKTRLQGHKILFDQVVLAEAPSDQSANNQSTTPTNVSEAISDYPTPINLPVNQSHVTDSRWEEKEPFCCTQPKLLTHRIVST